MHTDVKKAPVCARYVVGKVRPGQGFGSFHLAYQKVQGKS